MVGNTLFANYSSTTRLKTAKKCRGSSYSGNVCPE